VFDFLQGQKIPLRLLHVDPSANANQLYAVRLALPVNTEIAATPGMNATVEVAMRQETEASVEIPASALFSNGDKMSYVWIYRQDGTIARRRVEVARLHTDGTATIADGLNEGERIVVAGVHKLTEGQRVAPLPAPSKTNEGGLL
jgi:multidrug efflux system membrane fusion protein